MSAVGSLEDGFGERTALGRFATSAPTRAGVAAIIAAAAILSAGGIAASLAADAPAATRLRYAMLNALIILVPIGVGLFAAQRAAHRRFGGLLIAAGLVWSTAALAHADSSVLYSVGRIGGWFVTGLLICLVLAYPTGVIASRLDRCLAGVTVALLGVLYLPTAVLVDAYPSGTPWSACGDECPANAFMLLAVEPGFVEGWIAPLREAILFGVFVCVILRLTARIRGATIPQRQMFVPVLTAAIVQMLALVAFVVARRAAPDAAVVGTLGWIFGLCVVGVALGFLVGFVRWRLFVARALQHLALATQREMDPRELRDTVARAVADRSLEMVWLHDATWVDPAGGQVAPPTADAGETVTELRSRHTVVAALVHDSALADDDEFIAAVAAFTVGAVERQSVQATIDAGLREVEESGARMLAEADGERGRLERDLHDGAQQRLVTLGIRLELAREALAPGDDAGSATMTRLKAEVDEILDEIRLLGRGVHPSLLTDRGLSAALQAAAARTPVPAHVEAGSIGRYSPEIELAIYYACLEALQNVAKHAHGATGVWITLRAESALTFEVRDDGVGFDEDTTEPGLGLASMRDRIAAIGGALAVSSAPSEGTRITGQIPVPMRP